MPLATNAQLVFSAYDVVDEGIRMTFYCSSPGPGEQSLWSIVCTDAELSAVSTQQQLATLVRNKLERKFRSAGIASKLDPFIGQSLTI